MKLPPLAYSRPVAIDDAVLALGADGAVALAGGHSLLPQLSQRKKRATTLVDLGRVEGLAGISQVGGELRIAAMTRQRELERSTLSAEQVPLLPAAARNVATPVIRNRGTVGGSLVNADAGAELVVALFALDAQVEIASPAGTRREAVTALVTGFTRTSLARGELVTAVLVAPSARFGFAEVGTRPGDYADASAAVVVRGDLLRIAVGSVAAVPVVVEVASSDAAAAVDAVLAAVDPPPTVRASSAARQHLVATVVRRAVAQATAPATEVAA